MGRRPGQEVEGQTAKGGIKVFYPLDQTRALLANMISRALVPGEEP